MNFEELLVRYLDGQTAQIEEEELMAQMAVSPEKRSLLRTHLHLRESMERDAASLRPTRKQRDNTVALLLTTATTVAAGSVLQTARAATGHAANWVSRIGFVVAGTAVGAVGMYAAHNMFMPPPATPTPIVAPVVLPAPQVPTDAEPVVNEPSSPLQSSTKIQYERVIVPETVRVTQPPLLIHDTIMLAAPAPKMINVPPTVTIQRETVYVGSGKKQ